MDAACNLWDTGPQPETVQQAAVRLAQSAKRRQTPRRQTEREEVLHPILRYLQAVGCPRQRVTVTGRPLPSGGWAPNPMRGWADIVALLPGGQFWAIECKAGTGQSDAQKAFEQWVTDGGGVYTLARSVDAVRAVWEARAR